MSIGACTLASSRLGSIIAVKFTLGIFSSRTEWFQGPSLVPKDTPPAPTKPTLTSSSLSSLKTFEVENDLHAQLCHHAGSGNVKVAA